MLSVAEIGLGAVSSVGHGDDVTRGSWIGNCSDPSTSCTDTLITSGCFVAFLLDAVAFPLFTNADLPFTGTEHRCRLGGGAFSFSGFGFGSLILIPVLHVCKFCTACYATFTRASNLGVDTTNSLTAVSCFSCSSVLTGGGRCISDLGLAVVDVVAVDGFGISALVVSLFPDVMAFCSCRKRTLRPSCDVAGAD